MGKRFYHTAFFILISCNLLAQVKIITRADSLFFVGIDNEVSIEADKIPTERLSIKMDGGFVSGKNGKYIIRCPAPTKEASVKIFYGNKLVAEKKMQVVRVSDPVVYVVGDTSVTGGLISKKHLLTFDSLIVKINVPYLSMAVIRFEFKRISNNHLVDSLKNFSDVFSEGVKKIIKKTLEGDVIIFENIYSGGPDSGRIIHQSIKLTVTE